MRTLRVIQVRRVWEIYISPLMTIPAYQSRLGVTAALSVSYFSRLRQALTHLGDSIGRALVPYYRQLLPIMAIFANKSRG